MIKVEIHTLDGQFDIEIKKNKNFYSLLVILSTSQYFKENGRVWNGKIIKTDKLLEIVSLIKDCHKKPSLPTSISINDGRVIKIKLNDNESQIVLSLINIDENTNEFELIQNIKAFINEVTGNNTTLQYYIETFMKQ
jgi:hypothetical protein